MVGMCHVTVFKVQPDKHMHTCPDLGEQLSLDLNTVKATVLHTVIPGLLPRQLLGCASPQL